MRLSGYNFFAKINRDENFLTIYFYIELTLL